MGKPTKNDTGSGGDERDERKITAGSSPSKASSNTVKRLGDNESSRAKTGVRTSARQSNAGRGVVKQPHNVTIHSPLVKGPVQALIRAHIAAKPTKPVSEPGIKTKSQTAKMKQETDNLEHKPADDFQESSTLVDALKQQVQDSSCTDELTRQNKNWPNGDEASVEKNNTDSAEESKQNGGDTTNEHNDEFKLHLENEEQNNGQPDSNVTKESSEVSKTEELQSDVKTLTDESTEGSQTDTETCSVDVVESTTTELSEATESIAASESKNGESQDENIDDALLDSARHDCSVQLMDVMKNPQCAGLIKKQKDPLERSNPRSKSKIEESENSRPETPSKSKLSDYKQIKARRSLRPGLTYKSQFFNSSLFVNTSMDESGPSSCTVSEHYLGQNSDSSSTGTNGSTSISERKKANLLRRNEVISPIEEKKQKLEGDKQPRSQNEISRTNMPITPITLRKWCTIM